MLWREKRGGRRREGEGEEEGREKERRRVDKRGSEEEANIVVLEQAIEVH